MHKLIGFGKPDENLLVQSSNNSITFIIEDEIKSEEIMAIPLFLPEYLRESGNKLIFNISLAYKFKPNRSGHLDYLPIHIAFTLIQNLDIDVLADKKLAETRIKTGFSWSEDNFGRENCLFSNAQHKEYRLQPKDLKNLNGEVAIAVRGLAKVGFLEDREQSHPFSIVVRVEEEIKNETEFNLYDEMQAINEMELIGDVEGEAEVNV